MHVRPWTPRASHGPHDPVRLRKHRQRRRPRFLSSSENPPLPRASCSIFHGPSCGADLPSTENKSADKPCETRKLLDARKPEVQSERNGQNGPSLQKCSHSPLRPRFPTSDPATGSETLTTPPGPAQRRATLSKLRVLGAPCACSEGLSRCRPAAGSDVHV